ncbi:MAG: DUF5995 family protein [Candidatus Thiodiazotropha sp.]
MKVCDYPHVIGPVVDAPAADAFEGPRASIMGGPATLALLREELQRLETEFCRVGNYHGFFISCYVVSMRKCESLVDAIRDPHHPHHQPLNGLSADLIHEIAARFSQHYFQACSNYMLGAVERVPEPWRRAFDYSRKEGADPLRCMLAGLIAHSCYDLPLVLSESLPQGGGVYDRSDRQHVLTYGLISRFLTDELGAVRQNLRLTRNLLQGYRGRRMRDLSMGIAWLMDKYPLSTAIGRMLHAVHREAKLNCFRLQRGRMNHQDLSRLCCDYIDEVTRSRGYLTMAGRLMRIFFECRR